jgi:sodium-dependent dicarboxylate transporter 2/3/5
VRTIGIAAGLAAFVLLAVIDSPLKHQGAGWRPAIAAGVTALMAIWWLTEALPMNVTACLPILVFPIFGVVEGDFPTRILRTLAPYVSPYIFLFMGGMSIGAAMQQWNLHRRIALFVMRIVGTKPSRLLLGFLIATSFISLWISNTATAAMMLPIGISLINQCEANAGHRLEDYGAAIMLAIAYAANIGGIGTKIGTASNGQFAQHMATLGVEVDFLDFSLVGFPFVLMMLPPAWWLLWRIARRDSGADLGRRAVDVEISRLGPMTSGEVRVLAVFGCTALAWIAAEPLSHLLLLKSAHVEAGAAMLAFALLMLLRADGRPLLEAKTMRHQPWGTLLLLGGSFAMAEGIQQSGLAKYAAGELAALRSFTPFHQVFLASLATVGLSAVASNTATTAVMLGVLTSAVSPELVGTALFSVTIAASCDFALPAGTPPNAIVFASGYLTVRRMATTGVVLDLIAATLAAIWCTLVVGLVL